MSKRTLCAMFVLAALPGFAWAQAPLGPEFQVNTHTTSSQSGPAVAVDPTGRFLVAWHSYLQDGSSHGVFAQAYDNLGNPEGAEFQVNDLTAGSQGSPRVTSLGNLEMVVVWNGQDGSEAGVFGRRVHVFGGVIGSEFAVNAYTTFQQAWPSVAADGAGGFVVAWDSRDQIGRYNVFARRFNPDGTPRDSEFRVNSSTTGIHQRPDVALLGASGNFLVVWTGADYSQAGIFGQRYDFLGTPVGADFQVNTYTPYQDLSPSVAAAGDGSFVVAWENYSVYPQYASMVRARRYDSAGAALGSDFVVNSYTTWMARHPQVSSDPSGNFVVVWDAVSGGAGETWDGRGRRYDALGTPGSEFRLNSYTTHHQQEVAVASKVNGDFVAVWMTETQDGDGLAVFGQRFAPDPVLIFRDDFEAHNLTAWSAAAVDGGDLAAAEAAALKSTNVGLLAAVDDTAGLYVQDDSPRDENRYRARFYLDPNGFDPGEAQVHRRTRTFVAFSEAPTRRVAAIVLRRLNGAFSILGRARLDDNTQAETSFHPITDAPHVIEIDLRPATGPDALDGVFEMWIDGVSPGALFGLDNSQSAVDFVRLGALSVKTGASGTIHFDEFESRRQGSIGP